MPLGRSLLTRSSICPAIESSVYVVLGNSELLCLYFDFFVRDLGIAHNCTSIGPNGPEIHVQLSEESFSLTPLVVVVTYSHVISVAD